MPSAKGGSSPTSYEVIITHKAEQDLHSLDSSVANRILNKLYWLGENAGQTIHHSLVSVPDDLKGLCRLRVGAWRILYWVYHEDRKITIYGVMHRSKVYKNLQ